MLYLWIFGNNVEDAMTRPRFVVFYLVCGMAATAAQVARRPRERVPMIGASGAIAGVLGAYLVLFPRQRGAHRHPAHRRLARVRGAGLGPARRLVRAAGRRWPPVATVRGEAGVAFFAHVGGFVAGMALVLVFARRGPVPGAPPHGAARRGVSLPAPVLTTAGAAGPP